MNYFDAGGKSDIVTLERSKVILAPLAVGTYNAIRIPKFAFVKDVWLDVLTACTTAGTIACTVGFAGNGETADVDYFMVNADTAIASTGLVRASQAATPFEGKRFTAANGIVTVTVGAGGALTAGKIQLFCEYATLH